MTIQPHKYATYGIVPSTAPSSDDESEDTLPRSTLNAPIEALQGLANAAAEAAAAPAEAARGRTVVLVLVAALVAARAIVVVPAVVAAPAVAVLRGGRPRRGFGPRRSGERRLRALQEA